VFESKPDAVRIVYAGQRAEWKDPANAWRQAPFSVKGVPTLIKVTADGVSFPFPLSILLCSTTRGRKGLTSLNRPGQD
jgi:hypothetical protein